MAHAEEPMYLTRLSDNRLRIYTPEGALMADVELPAAVADDVERMMTASRAQPMDDDEYRELGGEG